LYSSVWNIKEVL